MRLQLSLLCIRASQPALSHQPSIQQSNMCGSFQRRVAGGRGCTHIGVCCARPQQRQMPRVHASMHAGGGGDGLTVTTIWFSTPHFGTSTVGSKPPTYHHLLLSPAAAPPATALTAPPPPSLHPLLFLLLRRPSTASPFEGCGGCGGGGRPQHNRRAVAHRATNPVVILPLFLDAPRWRPT